MNNSRTVDIVVDGSRFWISEKNLTPGSILILFIDRLQYMSISSMLHAMRMTARLIYEYKGHSKSIDDMNDIIDRYAKYEDPVTELLCVDIEEKGHRNRVMETIVEYVMRSEGHGRLHGFGYVATASVDGGKMVTGVMRVNPEKESVNFK